MPEAEEPQNKTEIRTYQKKHKYTYNNVTREDYNLRTLNREQKANARARLRAYDRRDEMKVKTDVAKNDYEALLYEFRGWLNDEENFKYVE